MLEQWRAIPGFPDYEVSNLGRVRSWRKRGAHGGRDSKPRLLVPDLVKGYARVGLCKETKRNPRWVHRLVLEAFVGPCPEGMEARHFPDRTPTNNTVANLSWATHKDNSRDKIAQGTMPMGDRHYSRTRPECLARGERNGRAKLTAAKVRDVRAKLARGMSVRAIAATFGICPTNVIQIKFGRSWAHVRGGQ